MEGVLEGVWRGSGSFLEGFWRVFWRGVDLAFGGVEPDRRRGVGERYYMYIYIYTGPHRRLRKARSQRRPLQLTSLAKPWGEFEGGGLPGAAVYTPLGRANQSQNSLKISVWFLVTFWKVSGGIWGLIFDDFPALVLIKKVIYFSIEFSSIFGWDLGA